MKFPNFFIVGAPKSATTAMHQYLSHHPDVYLAHAKELHFFGTDLEFLPPARNFSSRPRSNVEFQRYLDFFSSASDVKVVGEASVWYLYSRRAATEIREFLGEVNVLIMLRNPVDLLYSMHSQFLWEGNECIESFEEALAAEDDRRQGRRLPKTVHFPQGLLYTETVRFYDQVARYLDVFGSDRVLVLLYEDFVRDPSAAFRSVLSFLSVSEMSLPDFDKVNPNKVVRSKILRDLLIRPPSWVLTLGKTLLPRFVRSQAIHYLRQANTRYASRAPLRPETRARLLEEVRPEIERLQALLNRDLSLWLESK